MYLLIDGYNLLHASNVFIDAVGEGSLDQLHTALLDRLLELLGQEQASRTTVVFDAKGKRAATRRLKVHAGITVHYASRKEDADHVIAELIEEHATPREVTVVSSDHQVQRWARRAGAKPVDSEIWLAELRRRRRQSKKEPDPLPGKVSAPESPQEVQWWLKQLNAESIEELTEVLEAEVRIVPTPAPQPEISETPSRDSKPAEAKVLPEELKEGLREKQFDVSNPFPADYVEDIAREIQNKDSVRLPKKLRKRKPRP